MKPQFDVVWNRIQKLQGETFVQIRGRRFTYVASPEGVVPSTTAVTIPRDHIARAYELVPVSSTVPFQRNLLGPSYLYAILMDGRVRQSDW